MYPMVSVDILLLIDNCVMNTRPRTHTRTSQFVAFRPCDGDRVVHCNIMQTGFFKGIGRGEPDNAYF